jgi:F-type H+-transporting ATPase subunit gamma
MTILYQYLLEGLASEHSSRVSAMRNASDNAAELGEELRINFNRARQAAITQEIAEIVGGSSAVS